jgi:hypothetical protein
VELNSFFDLYEDGECQRYYEYQTSFYQINS